MTIDPRKIAEEFVVEHEKQVVVGELTTKTAIKAMYLTHSKALFAEVVQDEVALRAKLVSIGAAVVTWIKSLDQQATVGGEIKFKQGGQIVQGPGGKALLLDEAGRVIGRQG